MQDATTHRKSLITYLDLKLRMLLGQFLTPDFQAVKFVARQDRW